MNQQEKQRIIKQLRQLADLLAVGSVGTATQHAISELLSGKGYGHPPGALTAWYNVEYRKAKPITPLTQLLGDVAKLLSRVFTRNSNHSRKRYSDCEQVMQRAKELPALLDAIEKITCGRQTQQVDDVSDPLEAMHDRMKQQGATDKDIGEAYYSSRKPTEKNKLIAQHGGAMAAINAIARRCEYIRKRRKQQKS